MSRYIKLFLFLGSHAEWYYNLNKTGTSSLANYHNTQSGITSGLTSFHAS